MKQILIIEDEKPAAKRLRQLITKLDVTNQVIDVIDSVEDAVAWFRNMPMPDLAFFDIQLADGISFQIFEQVEVTCPIIFTTAFDEYAINAFKVNAIDYLLKPINVEELQNAWNKFQKTQSTSPKQLMELVVAFQNQNQQKNYKERFLIKKGDQFKYLNIKEIAYFYSEDGLTFAMDNAGKKHLVDEKLDALEKTIQPRNYFRINRKFIIGEQSVSKISTYFNSRLILDLSPRTNLEVIVSRERVVNFKQWLSQ